LHKFYLWGSASRTGKENRMETIKVSEFAELVGVSTRTVSDLIRRKVIERVAGGVPHPAALQAYVGHLRETAAGRSGGAAAEVATERAALLRLQRERAEFELSRSKKEYLPLAEVNAAGESVVRCCRMAVMAIADRIGQSVGLSREGYVALKEECRIILTDISKTEFTWFEDDLELYRLQEKMNHDELSK
jgi:phage terminase Nu1 subunit (DNA packaging protein)